MNTTISAIPVYEEKKGLTRIVPFEPTKPVKYRLDGEVKRTHPNAVVGRSTKVRPLKESADFAKFVNYFRSRAYDTSLSKSKRTSACRDYAIIMMGFTSGLRVSDIICRKWSDLYKSDWTFRPSIVCRQQKTGKYGEFWINGTMKEAVEYYRGVARPASVEDYMFPSGSASADAPYINRRTPWLAIKTAASACDIDLNLGTHSLRKTFGYKNTVAHKDDAFFLATLMQIFGHSSESITLRYIGIEEDEQKKVFNELDNLYASELGGK